MKQKELLAELKQLSYEQLKTRLTEVSRALLNLRIKKKLGQFNPANYRNLKKERSRILTLMREKKIQYEVSRKSQPSAP
ncbi:MAG: 50S ribosomal protein L29 [Deltaproteobacteria bacterium]|nr:50S ribosomal protein L29 [Deltaproteobacteria bacterium]